MTTPTFSLSAEAAEHHHQRRHDAWVQEKLDQGVTRRRRCRGTLIVLEAERVSLFRLLC
jgi:hypothetical protein